MDGLNVPRALPWAVAILTLRAIGEEFRYQQIIL